MNKTKQIHLPAKIAEAVSSLNKQHFTITDDGHTLLLRVEQQNDKAITTLLSNAQLGEYLKPFRSWKWCVVTKQDLLNYGRTDVTFYKIDDEQYFMDFHV